MTQDEALRQAAEALARDIRARVRAQQGGVPTFFDNYLLSTIERLGRLGPGSSWEETTRQIPGPKGARLRERLATLRRFLARRGEPRFVAYHDRLPLLPEANPWPSEVERATLAMSQGTLDCLRWRGLPLFKTVFEFSLYPLLLWELRPRTVIELGSGNGSSALWLADLLRLFDIDGRIYSLDLAKPAQRHEAVTFLDGDCRRIETAFGPALLERMERPWLLIEDAHVNVFGVLAFFHPHLRSSDYVVVEDSLAKREALARLARDYPGCYLVDTRYTDFFGRNATSAMDSILARQ